VFSSGIPPKRDDECGSGAQKCESVSYKGGGGPAHPCAARSQTCCVVYDSPKHTVLYMTGLTSPVGTIDMFQMAGGESVR